MEYVLNLLLLHFFMYFVKVDGKDVAYTGASSSETIMPFDIYKTLIFL